MVSLTLMGFDSAQVRRHVLERSRRTSLILLFGLAALVTFATLATANDMACVALMKFGHPAPGQGIVAVLAASSPEQRSTPIRTGGRSNDQPSPGALSMLLADPDPKVRRRSVLSVDDSTDAQVVLPLIQAFNDRDEDVRVFAIMHFQKHRDARVVEPLLAVLRGKRKGARDYAAKALGHQQDHRAVPDLLDAVRNAREDVDVRGSAAVSLGKIGDPSVLDTFILILQDRSVPAKVRTAVVVGFGCLSNRAAAKHLMPVLKDTRETVTLRVEVAQALVKLNGDHTLEALSAVAKTEGDNALVRCWAAIGVVTLTNGAIDDLGLVAALHGIFDLSENEFEFDSRRGARVEALKRVCQHGKDRKVRDAARQLLQEGGASSDDSLLPALCAFYYVGAFTCWTASCCDSQKRLRVSRRSLFVLLAIIAAGLPLVVSAFDLWPL